MHIMHNIMDSGVAPPPGEVVIESPAAYPSGPLDPRQIRTPHQQGRGMLSLCWSVSTPLACDCWCA